MYIFKNFQCVVLLLILVSTTCVAETASESGGNVQTDAPRPNIILLMSDDQGWGDTGFNGHPVLQTPNIDQLSANGMTFNHFYAGAPVCSPTRASVLTGRHPKRMGIDNPNSGELPEQEVTIAEIARSLGYRTAHFGKWHLGTMTHDRKDSNRGAVGNVDGYSPPWEHGYDVVFATEAKLPTFDPMVDPEDHDKYYGTAYWTGPGQMVPHEDPSLLGDDSRVLMDRVIPFIKDSVRQNKPFFTTVWLHAPHDPVIADPTDETYLNHPELSDKQRTYYTIVTQMDRQIGRLWSTLKSLGITENTLLAFTSDNGPSHVYAGSTGGLRGFKQDLYEGGIRVPSILVWPSKIPAGSSSDAITITHDYLPTLLDIWQTDAQDMLSDRPMDGRSMMPLVRGESVGSRQVQFAFTRWDASKEPELPQRMAIVDGMHKLISYDYGENYELYDLSNDMNEKTDIAANHPDKVNTMKKSMLEWFESTKHSRAGEDY